MKILKHLSLLVAVLLSFGACSEEDTVVSDLIGKQELKLQSDIEQLHTTRVNDNGFTDGDAIGVYVVDYLSDGQPGRIKVSDNNANNVKFLFHEKEKKWTASTPIYWKNKQTPVDIYGYFPYVDEITNVDSYPFEVAADQTATIGNTDITGYEKSDFLWAKSTKVAQTTAVVNLKHRHIMACVKVSLLKGKGFTDAEWAEMKKIVMIENTHRSAFINLGTSEVTVDRSSKSSGIVASGGGNDFWGIVVPQTIVAQTPLLSITVDGESYHFKRAEAMKYLPSKCHKFSIEVNRMKPKGDFEFNLVNEAISPWETDPMTHNGKVKEYLVVHVEKAGELEKTLKKLGKDPSMIQNIKLVGELEGSDCDFIREKMRYLEALNLQDVIFRNCRYTNDGDAPWEDYVIPEGAFMGMKLLTYVTLPKKLKKIGDAAFRSTIMAGSLIIPEGVTHIGGDAFSNWEGYTEVLNNFTGELKLPSTLKVIGGEAFRNCGFTGELRLPEGIKEIGNGAFAECKNFTGQLTFPSSLTKLEGGFWGLDGMCGHLVLPKCIKNVSGFGPNFTSVSMPEGVTHLGYRCISGLKGDVHLPSTIRTLDGGAFEAVAVQHVNLPDELDFLSYGMFNYSDLRDTFKIPPKVTHIPENAFANNKFLEAVIIPAGVVRMDNWAFANCYSLSYIRCMGMEPPVIPNETVFQGVAKDNFTLVVPKGAVAAYRSAPFWKEFKRISSYRNFVCRPSIAKVLNAGGARDLILNADANWKVTHCPSWCHLSVTEGFKKTPIKLTIDAMAHGMGNRTDSICFQLIDSQEHTTYMKVSQYDYVHDEDAMVQIQQSTKGNGVDIYIVGDGYDAEDISNGTYLQDMRQEMEYFFGVEPYTTYRDYFNFYTSIALSYESGIGSLNVLRNTKFNTSYGNFTADSRIGGPADDVVNYAVKTVPKLKHNMNRLLVILVPNANIYDGLTVMWENGTAVAYCPKSDNYYPNDARGVLQHEACGHGFGKLGDEYIYHQHFIQRCPCVCCRHAVDLEYYKSKGWYPNLSLNGKYRNHEWSQFIFDPRYSDDVDLYEGGFFHSWGVFRPEINSCMNNNIPYFNAPSRMAIVKRILEYAGEEFNFEKFVSLDNQEMGKDFTDFGTRSKIVGQDPFVQPLHAPVILKGSPLIK